MKIRVTKIRRFPGKPGRALKVRPLVKAIEKVVADPLASREVKGEFKRLVPDVRTKELKRIYKKIVTIDRSTFRLRLFKKFRVIKRYGVAVGMPAYPTPSGLFSIQSKQVNPTWTAPNSPWAGEMAGQQIAGGAPDNPLRARWMGVSGAVGIHGTGQPWSIGIPRLPRLHPHDRARRHRPLQAGRRGHARAHPLAARPSARHPARLARVRHAEPGRLVARIALPGLRRADRVASVRPRCGGASSTLSSIVDVNVELGGLRVASSTFSGSERRLGGEAGRT